MRLILALFVFTQIISAQQIAVLQYGGGGDWYANPTSIPNLAKFTNQNCGTAINFNNIPKVKTNSSDIFNYPILFMTGHGNVFFSEDDLENLKSYLTSGGFLHISDNYGMDKYIRKQLKNLFPDEDLIEIPNNHPIYHQTFSFKNGLPKIHEHDKKAPEGLGIFYKGRLVIFYDYECDLSDGWEDQEIHNNPKNVRLKALQMGANIIEFAFKN